MIFNAQTVAFLHARFVGGCEVCGGVEFVERDHRWPKRWGGDHHPLNLQRLCRAHHRRKSVLECRLAGGALAIHGEWFDLAYARPARRDVFDHLNELLDANDESPGQRDHDERDGGEERTANVDGAA